MDWQLKHFSRESSISGRAFEPGDKMACLIFKAESGELQRMDLHMDELGSSETPESLLGCWTRIVKKTDEDPGKEQRLQTLASSEELFLSLFEADAPQLEEKEILKQILALMLERKRIIKPIAKSRTGLLEYQHTKSKAIYEVSMENFEPHRILLVQEQLHSLIG